MRTRLIGIVVATMATAVTVTATLAGPATADAGAERRCDPPIEQWMNRHADPLDTVDPDASLRDLHGLGRVVGGAGVVGLGESTHGSREQFRVKHRLVRYLVERKSFGTVAMEEDFASGARIDRYVRTGRGDPRQLVSSMSSPFWASEEILALVQWMREWNETHDDPVRFLGTDLLQLRRSSFRAVTSYVRRVAPDRVVDLDRALDPVRPRPNQFEWYEKQTAAQKAALIASARRASRLVESLDAPGVDIQGEYAEQHARAILGWYVNFANETGFRGEREVFIADSVQWWQSITGDKIAYWAANVHTSSAPVLTYRTPWSQLRGTMAGGHLDSRLGRRYVSIGTWFHNGAISSNYAQPAPHSIGAPETDMLEATLQRADAPRYLLDLRRPGPRPVRRWLNAPATMRVILPSYVEGEDGNDYSMTVPSLRDAFDAAVFIAKTTPSRLLAS